ncbi:MAG TPA: T9SS type A sorting domain-containing protein, partial [bacterium (Candidatus Stahlbacteria)]|nr:T9SS type A sorting domain-containing protein [Candidatus Stahlbacteria bacterium]
AKVKLTIFDLTGRVIERLIDQRLKPGYHTACFRSRDPAGIYFVRMETEGYQETKRVIIVR